MDVCMDLREQVMSAYPSAATSSRIAETSRALATMDESLHVAITHRPNPLSLISTRSKKRARSRNSPASIHIPMTMIM
jgi:hypothetical protein